MTDSEAASLRDLHRRKAGSSSSTTSKAPGWQAATTATAGSVFEANMHARLPGAQFVDLDVSHPIFHSFFEINDLDIVPQAYIVGRPIFRGLFEDNDPSKRLQMIVNYNTDISQFWEWSGTGLRPIDDTNEAYKLGVNYVIYGLTH